MRAIVVAALAGMTLAVLPASAVPAAEADGDQCAAPVIAESYDSEARAVTVSLPATGCPAREQTRFPLAVRIERSDFAGSDAVERMVWCGPFRSGVKDVRYSCEVEAALAHEPEEEADYTITVTYPGDDGEQTDTFESTCVSDESGAECKEANLIFTRHGGPVA